MRAKVHYWQGGSRRFLGVRFPEQDLHRFGDEEEDGPRAFSKETKVRPVPAIRITRHPSPPGEDPPTGAA